MVDNRCMDKTLRNKSLKAGRSKVGMTKWLLLAVLSVATAVNGDPTNLIKSFESFQSEPYVCAGGKLTIGYGTRIEADQYKNGISEAEADEMLRKDVSTVREKVLSLVSVDLSQGEEDALVSFVYNVGVTAFANSTMLKKLNQGDKAGAANEFGRWIKAGGKVRKGLILRREIEKRLFTGSG